jgi:hypothetical protein
VLSCQPQLQRLVLGGHRSVTPQGITKGEPLAPEVASRFGEMEPVPRRARRTLGEVVRDPGPVGRVEIRLLVQRLERCSRLFEVADAGHHVDQRLGREAGNGGRADVMDPAL